jgi:hypothetical protein
MATCSVKVNTGCFVVADEPDHDAELTMAVLALMSR